MSFDNMSGSFGEKRNVITQVDDKAEQSSRHGGKGSNHSKLNFGKMNAERIVDVVCISAIVVFLIVVICTWDAFSKFLFTHILFPVISVGYKIIIGVILLGIVAGLIYLRFRRRRRYW